MKTIFILVIVFIICCCCCSSSSYIGSAYYLSEKCEDKTLSGILACPITVISSDNKSGNNREDVKYNDVTSVTCKQDSVMECNYQDNEKNEKTSVITFNNFYFSSFTKTVQKKDKTIYYIMTNPEMYVNFQTFGDVLNTSDLDNFIDLYQNNIEFKKIASEAQATNLNFEEDKKFEGEIIFTPLEGLSIFTIFYKTLYLAVNDVFIEEYIDLINDKMKDEEEISIFELMIYFCKMSDSTKFDYKIKMERD
jgi:hypothetical protein